MQLRLSLELEPTGAESRELLEQRKMEVVQTVANVRQHDCSKVGLVKNGREK